MKVQMTIFWSFPLGSSDVSEETASLIFWVKGFDSHKSFSIDNTMCRNQKTIS